MPLNIIGTAVLDDVNKVPLLPEFIRWSPYLGLLAGIKYWSRGSSNTWERNLHGKVYIVTGATTQGMGTSVILEMARRGAQLIILSRRIDEWSEEWCESIRDATNNELIYLEQCDLTDLYEVRKFATRWLDNSPPRRLDGLVVMSGDCQPWGAKERKSSVDGIELQMATNFVGIVHLLNLLKPSFKAQPPDRDVRIIVTTCFLQAMGTVNVKDPLWLEQPFTSSRNYFSSSKLQLSLCMLHLQKVLLEECARDAKDGRSGKNVTISLVQPGLMRSPSLRRVISNGSVVRLVLLYCILLYPLLWLLTKNGFRGGQSILYALMTPELEEINWKGEDVKYIVNCSMAKYSRNEFKDDVLQKDLFENTVSQIEFVERKMAVKRNQKKSKGDPSKMNIKSNISKKNTKPDTNTNKNTKGSTSKPNKSKFQKND